MMNGTKKLMFGGAKTESPLNKLRKGSKKELNQKASKAELKSAIKKSKEDHDSVENKPLLPNIKIKCEPEESDSESSSFLDPVASPKFAKKLLDQSEIKQENVDNKYPNYTKLVLYVVC